ncbi:hypothetical protein AWL63_19625 [Sphingomonas panacis]|uniref:Uncharacterized protein n=1 Tax=Sphingomonas panacis TaxID=1560345 RepID=A0A1B3ZEL5_9SPHN|nr:hypothetical protein [Sphingomonas panacis]AOH85833.1 hypothetical protein AWL63_19625 [Sphingomonas panacis]
MDATVDSQEQGDPAKHPQLSAWLWKPSYAKLWWSFIPLWWAGMAIATRVEVLESFYRTGFAGYLNVLFFPMTALMVLGIGYVRERLDSFVGQGGATPQGNAGASDATKRIWEEYDHAMEDVAATTDMFDPRSGALWIGNPLNPNNSGYIDPHTGKHR